MAREKKNFEKSLNELEEIVEKLERGIGHLKVNRDVSKGVTLSKDLSKMLDEIEKKIIMVENENGEIKEEDFGG